MIARPTPLDLRSVAGLLLLAILTLWPPAAGAADAGGLRIVSQPDVEVTWEGVVLGRTDETGALDIGGIPPGTYSVSLRKKDYEELSVQLVVRPGTTTLSLRLKRLVPPLEPARALSVEPRLAPPLPETKPGADRPAGEPAVTPGSGPHAAPAAKPPPEPGAVATPPTNVVGTENAPAPPAERTPVAVPLLVGLLIAVAAGTALWSLARARRAAAGAPPPGAFADPVSPPDMTETEGGPEPERSTSREILEELQRREMALDGSRPPGPLRERGTVVELKEFKVIEEDS